MIIRFFLIALIYLQELVLSFHIRVPEIGLMYSGLVASILTHLSISLGKKKGVVVVSFTVIK